MSSYTGTLKSKKKSELQEIANTLSIATTGTKDDLETRIKDHLDANETKLQEDPQFSGLYGRKKRVSQVAVPVTSNESDDEGTPPPVTTRTTRKPGRAVALRNKATEVVPAAAAPPAEPTYSALPPSPVRSIHPPSPVRSVHPPSPVRSVLPPSPVRSIFNEVREAIEEPEVVVERIKTSELLRDSQVYLDNLRAFISNSSNIATVTVVSELLYIIYTIVPWQYLAIPLTPPFKASGIGASSVVAHLPYAPLNYLLTSDLYTTVFLWLLPTLLVPQLFGALISFSTPRRRVDPLSASIVRVACSVAGKWGLNEGVLDTKWRVLNSSVAAAFALSESIEAASRQRA